jgi:hypothetical protein
VLPDIAHSKQIPVIVPHEARSVNGMDAETKIVGKLFSCSTLNEEAEDLAGTL